MGLEVVRAHDEPRLAKVRALMEEHFAFMSGHWPHMNREAFAEELAALPEMYPVVLLALVDGEPAGCIAFRSWTTIPGRARSGACSSALPSAGEGSPARSRHG
jgi:hypothetical protein